MHDIPRGILKFQCETWEFCATSCTRHSRSIYKLFDKAQVDIFQNIYLLGVVTEKPYSKPLERNVVYTSIITLSHATSHVVK